MNSLILSGACLLGCVSFASAADEDTNPPHQPDPAATGSSTRAYVAPGDHPQARANDATHRHEDRPTPGAVDDPSVAPRGNVGTSPATTPGNPGISASRNGTGTNGGNANAGGTGSVESGGSGR